MKNKVTGFQRPISAFSSEARLPAERTEASTTMKRSPVLHTKAKPHSLPKTLFAAPPNAYAPLPAQNQNVRFSEPVVRGPEEAAQVGDVIGTPPIPFSPQQVIQRSVDLEQKFQQNPNLRKEMQAQPYPKTPNQQLDWCIAYQLNPNEIADPLWRTATNDDRATFAAYVRGVVDAHQANLPLEPELQENIQSALNEAFEPTGRHRFADPQSMDFPSDPHEQRIWAAALVSGAMWSDDTIAALKPDKPNNQTARAVLNLVGGVLAKLKSEWSRVPVLSERKIFTLDGDERVYAIHTPPGPRPPSGWPTILFFHGSYGGYAPEQTEDYQKLNQTADKYGFQVLYPVGVPQDRWDLSQTGRGMLNWTPVGAGPGGRNDRLVFELLKSLKRDGSVDASKTFIFGHSQGGFYVGDLIANWPKAFAGAVIEGAGLSVFSEDTDFAQIARKTPTVMRTHDKDIHFEFAEKFVEKLKREGYGDALRFDHLPNRGHEILPDDFEAALQFFKSCPTFPETEIGQIDGSGKPTEEGSEVFRPLLDPQKPEFVNDAEARAIIISLAQNPWIDQDGDKTTLTLAEWKVALGYLPTFGPDDQRRIQNLRKYFVVAPPPTGAQINLSRLPPELANDPGAMAAAQFISGDAQLDLDGYPQTITAKELDAAERAISSLRAFLKTPTP